MTKNNIIPKFLLSLFIFFALTGCSNQKINIVTPPEAPVKSVVQPIPVPAAVPLPAVPTSFKLPILVYHSVRPDKADYTHWQRVFSVDDKIFRQQMQYLKDKGYQPVTFSDLDQYLRGVKVPPAKPVIISLDDGVDSQYKYAWPILKELGLKATFFIYPNPLNHENKHFISWDQLKEISLGGMEIGDHTMFHPYLTKISDPVLLNQEINTSKKQLEDKLNIKVNSIAYPFGLSNQKVIDYVKNNNYIIARGLKHNSIISEDNRFDLGGYIIPDNMKDFQSILEK